MIDPKCINEGKADTYCNTGHLLPCCMLDDGTEDDKWITTLRSEHLKVENVSSVKEIHHSDEWLAFHTMLLENPDDAPRKCKSYCGSNKKRIPVVDIGNDRVMDSGNSVKLVFNKQ